MVDMVLKNIICLFSNFLGTKVQTKLGATIALTNQYLLKVDNNILTTTSVR